MDYPLAQLDFPREFASFAALCRAIYGEKAAVDEAMYRWLFPENVFNPAKTHFLHVARDGDRVIASDGLLPVPLIIDGNECLAAWSIKTMTHPEYRRQGLFRALTAYSLERARHAGIQLVLGFANSSSYPGYEKFGWRFLFERKAVLRPLDIRASLGKRALFKPFAQAGNRLYQGWDHRRIARLADAAEGFETVVLSMAPRTAEALWPPMADSFSALVCRKYPYIQWRYNQRPRQDYKFVLAQSGKQPLGGLIFRIVQGACYVVDFLGPSQSPALPALLYRTVQYCLKHDVRHIISSSGASFDRRLKSCSFKPLSAPLANNMLIACPLVEIDLTPLKQPDNWFYSYGDSELDLDLQPQSI